ncbi:B12-binding domain-containing radical SAM protein [Candidatus Omnitrophota bacterium]
MKEQGKTDCLLMQSPFSAQGILPHSDSHTMGEGILSISAFLGSKGITTEIFCVDELYLDIPGFKFNRKKYDIPLENIKELIREISPRVVGISALTPQYPTALDILRLCKEADSSILTFIGGPHVTFTDRQVFSDSEHVDVVVRGEGEWTVADLMQHIKEGKPLDDVLGITFRRNEKIIRNDDRPFGNLEELPPVDYSKPNQEYLKKCNFFLTFTRGCPFNCSYCVEGKFWGNCVRARSVETVLKEVRYLINNFGEDTELLFLGSIFNAPEKFFRTICKELKNMDIGSRKVSVLVSAAFLPEEHVRLMAEAGIKKLLIAVESASPVILEKMQKKISFDMVVEKCKLIRKYGLQIGTFWLFGHPGETEETAKESFDAMVHLWENDLNDKQEIAIFTPYPGLAITKDPEKYGYKIISQDISEYSRFDKPVIELNTISYDRLCEIYWEARQIAQYWLSCKNEIFSLDLAGIYQKVHSRKRITSVS